MTFDTSLIPCAKTLSVEITEASPERVVGKLLVRPELCTSGGTLHGGAVMSLADSLGAVGAFLSLPAGAAKVNTTVTAEATPVHSGKRTGVSQTKITSEDGKAVALVIQTQLVLT